MPSEKPAEDSVERLYAARHDPRSPMSADTLNLYWCETRDHFEDWFVVALEDEAAEWFFREREGYEEEEVLTTFVLTLPADLQNGENGGWPSHELLTACGARFISEASPRIVEVAGARWVEGFADSVIMTASDDALERRGFGRPNGTRRAIDC
jgi:hypothetical protein